MIAVVWRRLIFIEWMAVHPGVAAARSMISDAGRDVTSRLIASASQDTTIRIWDAETYELRTTLPHERPVFSLAFHPRAHLLASSTGDLFDSSRGDLALWDVDSARVVIHLTGSIPRRIPLSRTVADAVSAQVA